MDEMNRIIMNGKIKHPFCWAIMEQMCEWGLEKGAGRTEEEVTLNQCTLIPHQYRLGSFLFCILYSYLYLSVRGDRKEEPSFLLESNVLVEAWVTRRKLSISLYQI